MRILQFGLSSSLGGIETYLLKFTTHLNKGEYRIDFLVIDDGKEPVFKKELIELGSNFYSVASRRNSWIQNIKDLNKLFMEENFDIVHCHMNSLSYITPIIIALKHRKKVIVHSHNGSFSTSFLSKAIHNVNFHRLPRKKVKLLAVSDVAGSWMFGEKSKYTVINNGIDLNKFKFSDIERKKVREELNINDDATVVLHVGAFRKQKNHSFLIDIFKEIALMKSGVKLLLVGEGELEGDIKKKVVDLKITDKVIFLGIRKNIKNFLSAADYFLFPSLFEGFPIALVEAQASGLTCIISDSITDEVVEEQMTEAVSLEKSAKYWAQKLLNKKFFGERLEAKQLLEDMELSVESEINTLKAIYDEL